MPYLKLYEFLWNELAPQREQGMITGLWPLDIYQRENDREHKQITFRLSIASYEKTLTDAEVTGLFDQVAAKAKDQLGAQRI
jgi:phenylalanyl-tRNA synthetase beta subunit